MHKRKNSEIEFLTKVTLRQLQTFVELCRWEKQAAAEVALGKSQSQISRDLSALESACGELPLFDRASRKPTEAGQEVLAFATTLIQNWHRLQSRLSGESQERGEVSLIVQAGGMLAALLPLLATLRQTRPGLKVRLLTRQAGEVERCLTRGEGEVGILQMDFQNQGLSLRPWLAGRIVAALPAAAKLAQRKSLSPAALSRESILIPSLDSPICRIFKSDGKKKNRHTICHEIGADREVALAAVASGMGVALFTCFDCLGDTLAQKLPSGITLRQISGNVQTVSYGLAVRKEYQPSAPALALIKALLRVAK